MENNANTRRIHPLTAVAAVSVILVSLVGVAAITGLLPNSHSTTAPAAATSAPASMAAGAAPATADTSKVAENNVIAQEKPDVTAPAPAHRPQPARPVHVAQPRPAPTQTAQICHSCGTVESVRAIQQQAQPSGLGAVAGAVLGGVLGNQVGGGDGRKLATVAAAVGGGFAGNEVEKRTRSTTTYEVRVRMEDGSTRNFNQSGQPGWRAGDRVRVVDGNLTSQG